MAFPEVEEAKCTDNQNDDGSNGTNDDHDHIALVLKIKNN